MGEKEKQTGSFAMERGRTEKVKTVRNRLMWVACLLPWAMVTSSPRLLPRVMSRSMSATNGHKDVWGLSHHLWPYWCLPCRLFQYSDQADLSSLG